MKKKMRGIIAGALSLSMCVSLIPVTGMTSYAQEVQSRAIDLNNTALAGYWNFDQAASGTTISDQSKHNLNGTLTGTVVKVEEKAGISGGTLRFGNTTENAKGYMDVEANVNASSDNFSLAFWVKYDANTVTGRKENINLIQQSDPGRTLLYLNKEGLYGTYIDGKDIVLSSTMPEENKWYHIVFVSKGSTDEVKLYINGELQKSVAAGGAAANGNTKLRFGAHKNEPSQSAPLIGYLDEVYLYKEVVDDNLVKELFAVGKQNADIGTVNGTGTGTNTSTAGTIKISIDPTKKIRDISSSMFGINHRYANEGYGTWDSSKQEMRSEFDAYFREASFGSLRYPGGTISNLFDWKKAIGDISTRIGQIHGLPYETNPSQISTFGLDEAANYCNITNTEMVYVYGMGQGSAADAADLVEYLNAPNDGSNPNGGTDWAAVRAANGHEEPYNIKHFEIGNEMNLWLQDYWMSGRQGGQQLHDAYIYGGEMKITRANQTKGGGSNGDNRGLVKPDDWRPSASLSSGEKNQQLYMRYDPVKEGSESVYVENTKWNRVDSLENQAKDAKVYTIDYPTGKVSFGDGVHGAIPEKGQKIMADYTTEQDGFIKYYQKMKEVDSSIKIYAAFQTPELVASFNSEKAKNQYDGISVHPYSDTGGSIKNDDPNFYEKVLAVGNGKVQNDVKKIVDAIAKNTTDKDTPKVPVVSEFGIFNHQADIIKSQTHAVYIAMCMIQFIEKGTPYINKHCLSDFLSGGGDSLGPSAQAVIQSYKNADGTVDFVSTPSAKAFSVFNNMSGEVQIENTLSENPIFYKDAQGSVNTLYTYSTKDQEGNVYLIAVNTPRGNNTSVSIDCKGAALNDKEVEVWTVDGDSYDAMNTLENKDNVVVEKTTLKNTENTVNYQLTPHSITAFKIPKAAQEDARKDVTIQFDGNGGTVNQLASVQMSGKEGVTIGTLPRPVNGTKVFKGWFAEKTGGSQLSHRDVFSKNMTVYALWADGRVIHYQTQGGKIDGDGSKIIPVNASFGMLAKPVRAGYDFKGWYLDEQCTQPVDVTAVPSQDVTVYAKWERTFVYTKISGLQGSASSVENNTVAASNALDGQPQTLWHSKYDGAGVIIDDNGSNNEYTITLPGSTYVGKLDYLPRSDGANGIITKYKLYYSADDSGSFIEIPGGAGAWENNTSLKSAVFTPVQAKRIQIRALQTEGTQKNKYISAAEFMLYTAKEQEIYTVDFFGGEQASGTAPVQVTLVPGDKMILPDNPFAKEGYEFVGWSDGTQTMKAGSEYSVLRSTKLTAVWKKLSNSGKETETGRNTNSVNLEAPINLKVGSQTTSSITFTWNQVKNASLYVIESYDAKTKVWKAVKEISQTTYQMTGLKPGTRCEVRVKAIGTSNGQNIQGPFSASVKSASKPGKTTLKKVKKIGAGKVSLKWSKKSESTGYEIYMKSGKGKYKRIARKPMKTISMKRGKLKSGVTYTFKVRTYINASGSKIFGSYSKTKKIKN